MDHAQSLLTGNNLPNIIKLYPEKLNFQMKSFKYFLFTITENIMLRNMANLAIQDHNLELDLIGGYLKIVAWYHFIGFAQAC